MPILVSQLAKNKAQEQVGGVGMVGQWTRNGELVVGAVAFNELVNAVVAALYNAITQSMQQQQQEQEKVQKECRMPGMGNAQQKYRY
ncbi:hypothetical protein ACLKA6_016376 [Drosophila palustris]